MLDQTLLRADLHMHSTASDGELTPSKLLMRAADATLTHMALTDHETLDGIWEAAAAANQHGITFIPGVEINTAGREHVHVLLYFVDNSMRELTDLLDRMQRERQERCGKILSKLNDLGIMIRMDDLSFKNGTVCGRPHLANALIKRGYVQTIQEAFDQYLDVDKPAYVPRKPYETVFIIQMARRIGAVPVLAHPGLIKNRNLTTSGAISRLMDAGLMGIEAYHPSHDDATCCYWEQFARQAGLLITGGSDYHADNDTHGSIGSEIKRWTRMAEDVQRFLDASVIMKAL